MMNNLLGILVAMLIGFFIGALFMGIITIGVDNIEIFERDGGANVVRIYKRGADSIYVEDVNDNYSLTLVEYLDTIPGGARREKEKVEIKTLVGWYE